MEPNKKVLVLFDGECKFCNFWVQFIKKRKSKSEFVFHPLQSDIGKDSIDSYQIHADIDSIVVIKNDKAFIKSSAALQVLKSIGGIWNLLLIFWVIPRAIRDWGYDIIAKNRHRFFKSTSCKLH
ncbi:MAG: thiol-disulfide oxidoreductase DCC family protein [Flavobacteriales bacterium]